MIYTLMSIHLFAHATASAGDTDLRSVPQVAPRVGLDVALWREQVDTSYHIYAVGRDFNLG